MKKKVNRLIELIFNPGYRLVKIHNFNYWLFTTKFLKPLGLLLWQFETLISSCHISPRCKLPKNLLLPHPTGIVIGDFVEIADDVVIYQNVTLGIYKRGSNTYPKIEKGVTIYAGAIVVGDITLRENAIIGANSFISGNVNTNEIVKPLSIRN